MSDFLILAVYIGGLLVTGAVLTVVFVKQHRSSYIACGLDPDLDTEDIVLSTAPAIIVAVLWPLALPLILSGYACYRLARWFAPDLFNAKERR